MRKAIAAALLTIGIYNAAAAQQFKLTGEFTGTDTRYIYFRYTNAEGKMVLDSADVSSHKKFSFKGTVDGPTNASLYGKLQSRGMDDPNLLYFFLEPGTLTASVKEGNFKKSHITGSRTQADMDALQKEKEPLTQQWAPFFRALDSVNKIDNFKFQEMKGGLKPYYKEMEKIDFAYIDKHPGSYLTAYLLRGYMRSLSTDALKAYYAQFPENVKKSIGKSIQEELERRKLGVAGTMAADFSAPDINGTPLQLSSFKGKYVLVDFWASWCLPCRKGNPHLKKLYAQYKDKGFEIIGVSDDDRKPEAWKKAVEQDGIGMWKHVLRGLDMDKLLAGQYNEKDISKKYGIYSLPTKILIDPQGKIIGRYEGGEEDDAKMDAALEAAFQ